MSKVLVRFERDWADEFDVTGLEIVSSITWEAVKTFVETNPDVEINYNFGTNEGWDCVEIEDFFRSFKGVEISEAEEQTLRKAFGDRSWWGICPLDSISELIDY